MVEERPGFPNACLCDTHVHTSLCDHATGEMEDYIQTAIHKGLKKIIFLEHMEHGINSDRKTWLTEADFDHYFAEGKRLQQQYGHQIDIGLGVECGFNPDEAESLKKRLASRQWDQIGISCHFLKLETTDDHINLFSRKRENIRRALEEGVEKLLERYFATLTQAVQTLPGTMICHLDGALRFVPGVHLTAGHYRQIANLLVLAEKRNLAVELNSSGYDIRKEQFPNSRILAMVFSAKIPCLCGSDAHRPQDVGRYFEELSRLLPATTQR
ncbi:MAG: histidinol-phosphatase [Desulforhopalus sp.]